jgi:TonB family protein
MKRERKDKSFVKVAYYKGGSKALEAFILANLQYPQSAFDKHIEGTIHAKYDINNRGKVAKVKLYNSLGYGCDEEAIRVIKLLEFEVPKSRGLRLTFHKEIHIHFRMPKTPTPIIETPTIEQSAALPNFNLQYNIVTETKSENSETKNNENLYNYTVSL